MSDNIRIIMIDQKELLQSLILDFQKKLPLKIFSRDEVLPTDSKKVISVCGVRRSGKTFVLFDTINRLIKSGVPKTEILFLSFDDERLQLKRQELDLILQSYRELYPKTDMQNVYIFFDEVQMADGWEQFVRRIYDSVSKHIFISGSNSKLLATDIATSLRGRSLQFEVFPMSFSEYCRFKNIETNTLDTATKALVNSGFNEYMRFGGFPELVMNQYRHLPQTIQEYYHVMLYRDLIERYQVKNIPVLKYFISRLLANHTSPTSINKIYNEIKSAGLKTDKNVLYDLSEQLEAINFAQRLGKFDNSVLKTELASERKVYFIDNGFLQALKQTTSNDNGKLLENAVFMHYRRQTPFMRGLYFYKKTRECDFVVLDREKPVEIIQACYNFSSPDTRKREISALLEASDYLKCNNLKIVSLDPNEEIKAASKTIRVINAAEVMLGRNNE